MEQENSNRFASGEAAGERPVPSAGTERIQQPDAYPHNLNIIVQSESEERQIQTLVELLLNRRRLEAMIEFGLTVTKRIDGYLVFRVHPSGSNEILVQGVNTSRDGVLITAREAIDLAIEILRDRQRQASGPASASPEAKQKT